MNPCINVYALLLAMIIEVGFQESKSIADDNLLQSDVVGIYQKLVDEEIDQIEILHIPANVKTYCNVTPEHLQKDFFYRLTIRTNPNRSLEKELVEALKTFKVQPSSEGTDLRWGIIFYDHKMRRVGAIFFGRVGSKGVIGSTDMHCNNSLFDWLVSHFSCCFEEQKEHSTKVKPGQKGNKSN